MVAPIFYPTEGGPRGATCNLILEDPRPRTGQGSSGMKSGANDLQNYVEFPTKKDCLHER